MVYESSLGDGLETTHCLFPHLQQTAKNSNSLFRDFKADKVYLGISEQIKPLQLVCQAAEFKFESKFEPLLVIWQSLPKVILWELNSIFYLGILEQIKLARLDWIKNVKF